MTTSPSDEVATFIKQCEPKVADMLRLIRQTIQVAVPDATEKINYGIPTFQVGGKNLLHYGPGKNHVGLYATPDGHAEFEPELSRFKRGKGSVQFPLDAPLPIDLIERIAKYRASQLRKETQDV